MSDAHTELTRQELSLASLARNASDQLMVLRFWDSAPLPRQLHERSSESGPTAVSSRSARLPLIPIFRGDVDGCAVTCAPSTLPR
jgi:hypothetical protein